MRRFRFSGCLAFSLAMGASAMTPLPGRARAVPAPAGAAYTRAQSVAGMSLFNRECAGCHGLNLQGGVGPPLTGSAFREIWQSGDKTIAELWFIVRTTMPWSAPNSLTQSQYASIIAYLLSRNGVLPGHVALGTGNARARIGGRAHSSTTVNFPVNSRFFRLPTTRTPTDSQLIRGTDAGWPMYNGRFSGTRFSPMNRITAHNAKYLRLNCRFSPNVKGSFEASPVFFGGLLYVTSAYDTFAIDPLNCRRIWASAYPASHYPQVLVHVNRGVAIYRGRLFRTTPDGHLIALDAKTGRLLWDTWVADPHKGYWLSAAPIAYDHEVFVGTAGADSGTSGFIYAFDARTGRLIWTFSDVLQPKKGQRSADSRRHGGGSTWSTYTLDWRKGLLLVSIGNPAPDMNDKVRPGDDPYTDSVVALHFRTGKVAWYLQQLRHDTHDWDTAAAPVIYRRGGDSYLAVANKAGWVYLYNRSSRKLLWRTSVTRHYHSTTPISRKGIRVCPGWMGGVEWNGAAYAPDLGLLYVNSVQWCATYRATREDYYVEGVMYLDGSVAMDPIADASGWTTAIDARTGQVVWKRRSGRPMVAALTSTAGGVVFTGSLNGDFLVLDARNGSTLYRFDTGGAIAGAASTYLTRGKQYVAVTAGNRKTLWPSLGPASLLVFSLSHRSRLTTAGKAPRPLR